jgi:hypothetical protein
MKRNRPAPKATHVYYHHHFDCFVKNTETLYRLLGTTIQILASSAVDVSIAMLAFFGHTTDGIGPRCSFFAAAWTNVLWQPTPI